MVPRRPPSHWRRFFACALGALTAAIFCAATITAASALGVQPRYPAYAGEDDFSLRAAWFLLLELPGFAVLGGWLGCVAAGTIRRGILGAAGMIMGTVIAFLVQSTLRPTIESLPRSASANVAVVAFLVAWLVLAGGGALLSVMLAGGPGRPSV